MDNEPGKDQSFEQLLDFLRNSRGFDFTGYKRSSLARRIDKRMQAVSVEGYPNYIDYLSVHPEEFVRLFNTILINVTSFFRDPQVWKYLEEHILPQLASKASNGGLRVWSVACASGEETYTIAMLLAEATGLENFSSRVKIYATDIDDEALNKARSGAYNPNDVDGIPGDLLEKYFEYRDGLYLVNKEMRRAVIFGRHNVIHDAPISRIDLLLCRNLLMYLNTATQSQVLSRLHFAIKDGGFLVLGKAEMIVAFSSMFTPLDLKMRVFQSAARPSFRDRLQMVATNNPDESINQIAGQYQVFEVAFHASPFPIIVVSSDGNLALANERARGLFGISSQDIGRPFQDLQLSYRPVELRTVIETVYQEKREIRLGSVPWNHPTGEKRFLDIQLTPLHNNGNGIIAVSITFNDVTAQVNLQEKLEHSNMELEIAMGELMSSNEELETTNEELQSTVEELETTNEELQSSNEELETMNEELHSTSEELEGITVQARQHSEELDRVNRLLETIISSLRGGVIVVDRELCILAWNQRSEDTWGVRSTEALGVSLFALDIGLPVDQLQSDIQSILDGENEHMDIRMEAVNRRGKKISCRLNLYPLVSEEDGIGGVILIVEDHPI